MNCPRCGEKLFGSVCPRCGNVVTQARTGSAVNRAPKRTSQRTTASDSNIKFMDSSGTKAVRPSSKKRSVNIQLYKIAVIVLAVICVFLFFRYNSVKSDLKEAEATINTQNDTIKTKDDEIAKLKTTAEAAVNGDNSSEDGEGGDSAPSVEFDENGNLINITDNGGSDSSDSDGSENKKTYKSGDTYTIKSGDTGSNICKEVYGKYTPELWEKILSANDMTATTQFHPGDELKIP